MTVFPTVKTGYYSYINQVSSQIMDMVWFDRDRLSSKARRGMRRRARAMRDCFDSALGQRCSSCARPRPESGSLIHSEEHHKPCKARSCPRCARTRSAKMSLEGSNKIGAVEELEKSKAHKTQLHGYNWRLVTFTVQYNPDDIEDFSISEINNRIRILRQAWRGVWGIVKKRDTFAGAASGLEIAGTGNIHLHVLMYSRYTKRDDLSEWAKNASPAIGFIDVRRADSKSIREVYKYSVKGPGSKNGDWLLGISPKVYKKDKEPEHAELINPKLAALWEIATYGMRLNESYGLLRDIRPELTNRQLDEEAERRLDKKCACGCGEWIDVCTPVKRWIIDCNNAFVLPFGNMMYLEKMKE